MDFILLSIEVFLLCCTWVAWSWLAEYWNLADEEVSRDLFLKYGDSETTYTIKEKVANWISIGWPLVIPSLMLALFAIHLLIMIVQHVKRQFFR